MPADPPLPHTPAVALTSLSSALAHELGEAESVPTTEAGVPLCPHCNTPMIVRTVKELGLRYGQQFWGCPGFCPVLGGADTGGKSITIYFNTPEGSGIAIKRRRWSSCG